MYKNINIYSCLALVVYPFVFVGVLTFLFFTCKCNKDVETEDSDLINNENTISEIHEFPSVLIPSELEDPDTRANYLVTHYWDNFDFNDTTYCHLPETTEQAFVNYAEVLLQASENVAISCIGNLLGKAEKEITGYMYSYFLGLAMKYFYNSNSPLRNDYLYILVAEYILQDQKSDEAAKERARFDLSMMMKNRIGEKAADISYTLYSGKTGTLYTIKSPYTLLYLYNPDCNACSEVIAYIRESSLYNKILQQNLLSILALYPDDDTDVWKRSLSDIPLEWVNGYDSKREVVSKLLYDLKAIPVLYLLDEEKNVILKDATVEEIEGFIENKIYLSRK
ncbi:MAG: DUF5106 domain-containing protein [Prevotella sp.]|jgi:hypothetical protein|nr:DUF5106 domain-containing protein [Prevotella sp.]